MRKIGSLSLAVALVAVFLVAGPERTARAQESVCSAALTPDITVLKASDSVRLAWLSIIDAERFREESKNVETGGSVLVYGYPISGYGNYGEFAQARDREFQLRQFNYSRDQAIEFLQSKVSGKGHDTFVACLEIEARKNQGLHVWARRVTDDAVDVSILWNVPGQDALLTATHLQVVGTQVPQGTMPLKLVSSANWEKRFARQKDKDFYLSLNFNGYTDSLRVAPEIVLASAPAPKICRAPASESDMGYQESRLRADIDNDGCEDFCRLVGPPFQTWCSFGYRDSSVVRPKVTSSIGADGGYPGTRFWVDYNGDGQHDFCRVVGSGNLEMWCHPLAPTGSLGAPVKIWSGNDRGYDGTSRWIDMDGNGSLDWCRQKGATPSVEYCFLNDRKALTQEIPGR